MFNTSRFGDGRLLALLETLQDVGDFGEPLARQFIFHFLLLALEGAAGVVEPVQGFFLRIFGVLAAAHLPAGLLHAAAGAAQGLAGALGAQPSQLLQHILGFLAQFLLAAGQFLKLPLALGGIRELLRLLSLLAQAVLLLGELLDLLFHLFELLLQAIQLLLTSFFQSLDDFFEALNAFLLSFSGLVRLIFGDGFLGLFHFALRIPLAADLSSLLQRLGGLRDRGGFRERLGGFGDGFGRRRVMRLLLLRFPEFVQSILALLLSFLSLQFLLFAGCLGRFLMGIFRLV